MFCIVCGTKNDDGAKFCTGCGARLDGMDRDGWRPGGGGEPAGVPGSPASPVPSVPFASVSAVTPVPAPAPAGFASTSVDAVPAASAADSTRTLVDESTRTLVDEPAQSSTPSGAGAVPSQKPGSVPTAPLPTSASTSMGMPVSGGVGGRGGVTGGVAGGNSAGGDGGVAGGSVAAVVAPVPGPDRRTRIMVTVLAALIALCVVVGGLVAWNVWGPREVPAINATSAGDVASQLEGRGFKVIRKKQYDGARKGSYVGLEGAKSGDRLAAGSTVTVVESMGPGVPEGTVGQSVQQAEQTLKPMGVTLTEHEVVSLKPGHVSVTRPADGDPVTDPDAGIDLGVGVEGDGIPVEIAGMNQDEAQSQLESMGYTVTLEPRFSSRKYLGRIVGANPGIGVKTDVKDVTLYYGVDASKRYDVLDGVDSMTGKTSIQHVGRLVGRYCTTGGDCITLDSSEGWGSKESSGFFVALNGADDRDSRLDMCWYTQSVRCAPAGQGGDEYAMKGMENFLISGKTGAFELIQGYSLPYCGDHYLGGGVGSYSCDNGVYSTTGDMHPMTGLTYHPGELFVYMPVDADLNELESDGYFASKTDFKPDADRPYLIRRDKAAYQPVSADNGAVDTTRPTAKGKPAPFKDAPNAKNVYYLEENPIDWTLLDGKTVSEGSSQKSATKTDYKPFAATYSFSGGAGAWYTSLKVSEDGTFSGHFQDANLGDQGDGYPNGTVEVADFTGRFSSIEKQSDGTYLLKCDAAALKLAGTPGESTIKDGTRYHNAEAEATGMSPCGAFSGYLTGTSTDQIPSDTVQWLQMAFNGGDGGGRIPHTVLLNTQLESGLPFVAGVQN
ncbi:serine/threonine protein kinase [Bifidobacterium myosotis]|uniref:Serine/threonine protein kinase n=2 Tax=Bifidobacterium myosotis TaxID=1630166 RepID=A0A261FMX2_9BIFI|nr:serine/threonine protein kinase [Bifidobacterium myosotis]